MAFSKSITDVDRPEAGHFYLRYIQDQQKREVDFLITREGNPWFLVEVKHKSEKLSENLKYFQEASKAPHAFQVIFEKDYMNATRTDRSDLPMRGNGKR